MLFKNLVTQMMLICSFSLLCVSCSSTKPTGSDDNLAALGIQNEALNQTASQERLGMAYLLGRGVPENNAQAVYWFQKAAEQGSGLAANELGYLYASGKGASQNYATALSWYQKAADLGLASAKYNLGIMYANGLGTEADQIKASNYFHEAAALGFAPARKRI